MCTQPPAAEARFRWNCCCLSPHRVSSGCTATAVSPSMVSGRVVATTISPLPSSRGYAKLVSTPNSTGCRVHQDRDRQHSWYGTVTSVQQWCAAAWGLRQVRKNTGEDRSWTWVLHTYTACHAPSLHVSVFLPASMAPFLQLRQHHMSQPTPTWSYPGTLMSVRPGTSM